MDWKRTHYLDRGTEHGETVTLVSSIGSLIAVPANSAPMKFIDSDLVGYRHIPS
jgi:hypothetical protein